MWYNLLAEEPPNPWGTYLMLGILVAIMVVFMVLNRRSQKKRQEETMNMLNAIQPGNKVKTIGGICGVVVEVCPEDNTFVLETGTEASGISDGCGSEERRNRARRRSPRRVCCSYGRSL